MTEPIISPKPLTVLLALANTTAESVLKLLLTTTFPETLMLCPPVTDVAAFASKVRFPLMPRYPPMVHVFALLLNSRLAYDTSAIVCADEPLYIIELPV